MAGFNQMRRMLPNAPIADVDLSGIEDGTYTGTFGAFLVAVTVRVTVESGRITGIEILDQLASPKHEARETIGRILQAQTPKVDAVTGATGSSLCIMAAVHSALTEGTE